jgi:hypothetical protein
MSQGDLWAKLRPCLVHDSRQFLRQVMIPPFSGSWGERCHHGERVWLLVENSEGTYNRAHRGRSARGNPPLNIPYHTIPLHIRCSWEFKVSAGWLNGFRFLAVTGPPEKLHRPMATYNDSIDDQSISQLVTWNRNLQKEMSCLIRTSLPNRQVSPPTVFPRTDSTGAVPSLHYIVTSSSEHRRSLDW